MREAVDAPTRRPIGPQLPVVFQARLEQAAPDDFLAAVVEAFDRALAPVHLVLDELAAYLDPLLAPDDLLLWLLGWLGLPDDRNRTVDKQRQLLAGAADLYRGSGTPAGLRAQLQAVLGWDVEVADNGATAATADPDAALPGQAVLGLHVRLHPPDGVDVDDPALLRRMSGLVRALKPAHVPHRVELVSAPIDGDNPSSESTEP